MSGAPAPEAPKPPPIGALAKIEHALLVAILAGMVILPVGAVIGRQLFGSTLATANLLTQYLNLWLTMLGALVAARAGRHLSLSTGELIDRKSVV